MEKRALLAAVISILIILVYQEVVLRYVYPPPPSELEVAEPTPAGTRELLPSPEVAPERAAALSAQPSAQGQRVIVDTDIYKATFTSAGARLESFVLKKYRTAVDPNSPPQEIVVPSHDGELPFGVELRGAQPISDAGVAYAVQGSDLTLKPGQTGVVEFVGALGSVTIRKRFELRGDGYEFVLTVSAADGAADYSELALTWVKPADASSPAGAEIIFDRAVYLDGRKLVEDTFDKLAAGKVVTGPVSWAGYAGRYFLATMIPAEPMNYRLWLKERDHTVEEKLLFPLAAVPSERRVDVYIGPKDFDALERVGHSLSRAVNLGWFGFIAVPMLHALKLLHGVSGNYGVDIVILTVIIKVLFIPLTQRSYRSMREMQKLQPQMAKIRERFKDTPEQMNKEIMELYRRHKVNPLGGCLPMVLQIPVFIGLYEALLNAVELRHAPFVLWINDLSAPDRLGSLQIPFVQHPGIPVLTLLMGASMFVQQWMTPSAGDPTQQRMMMIMPLMFTFMFVNFPSGLALYWLVNNLLTIAQQFYMNRTAT